MKLDTRPRGTNIAPVIERVHFPYDRVRLLRIIEKEIEFVYAMGLLKFVSELDDKSLNKASRWGLPIMLAIMITMSYGAVEIDTTNDGIPEVDITKADNTALNEDSALKQAEYIEDNGRPDFSWSEWQWTDGLPIAHSYAVYAIMPYTGGVDAIMGIHILFSFLSLFVIKHLTFRIWTLQEFASLNLSFDVDLEELEENIEELIDDAVKETVDDPVGFESSLTQDKAMKDEIAQKREGHEPSALAHLFAVVSMFCYFFYSMQSSAADVDSGIAMAQFFTLLAILLSTSRLEGKAPNKIFISLAIVLAIFSSPIGVIVILPVLLFLIIGELSEDKEEKSFKQKIAGMVLIGILTAFASSLLAVNLIHDFEATIDIMVSGFTDSLMEFAPFLAMLSIIPFRRLFEPVERSFVIYGGALFGLTFFLPSQLLEQVHYSMIIPGAILAAFALVSLIEDFSTNVIEKMAIHSVKFCSVLGGIPIMSTLIYASHQTLTKGKDFNDAVLSNFTTLHMIMIMLGLAGFIFMIFNSGDEEEESEITPNE
jgi:hypothetical protein